MQCPTTGHLSLLDGLERIEHDFDFSNPHTHDDVPL